MNEKTVTFGKDELVGFDRFVTHHYQQSMEKALKIAGSNIFPLSVPITDKEIHEWALRIFDKLATPLVFLKTAWKNELSDTERLAYYPDAEERAEKGRRLADEAKAMITQ